jgi:hypothetical protein
MKIKKYIWMLGLSGMVAMGSCDKIKDFGDTNVAPGDISTPLLSALLTNAEATIGGYAAQTRGGLYAQLFSETQYTDVSLYSLPQLDFGGEYTGILYDLQTIIDDGTNNNMIQVARILKSYVFWTITDRWGDVPYTEALKGNRTPPKFDTQETIYKGILAELTSAANSFNNTTAIQGDVIYGGNVDKWRKLANSLRMLVSLRLSKVYPGANDYAATQFKAALADPGGSISSNADNFTVVYPGGAAFRNPWYNTYDGRRDFAESKTMTDILQSISDGRAQVYGGGSDLKQSEDVSPNKDVWNSPSTIGFPYGVKRATAEAFSGANPKWARILRGDYREQTDPQVVVGAAHVLLARAEAADRGWTTENMNALYQQGINASFEQWGLPLPPATYFTNANVALAAAPGTGANLRQIATQQWIAYYPDGLQAWSNWRRTGFPVLTPAPDAVNTGKQIPRRYTYATSVYSTNGPNVQEAVSRLTGGDTQDSRIWWDKP